MITRWFRWGLVWIVCGLAAQALPGRTFHVDAVQGDDTRDGLGAEQAWRSLVQVNRATLTAGDQVLFRRGQSWRGQLVPQSGTAQGVITYGAFGTGAKPVLLGSVAADRPADWEPTGPGLWATPPLRFEPFGAPVELPAARWSLHQEGGAAATLTTAPANAGTGRELSLRSGKPGTRANHLQLSIAGLAVEADTYYLLTFRARSTQPFTPASVSLMKSGPPWTAYAAPQSALPLLGTNETEHTVRFHARQTAPDGRLTFFLGGAMPADCVVTLNSLRLQAARCNQTIPLSADVGNIIFDQGAATGFKKWRVADLRQEGDYHYNPQTWQVTLRMDAHPATRHRQVELALNRHIINEGGRSHVTYENLDLRYGAAHGIGGGSTHHITVRGCDISFIGGGHQLTRPDGKPVRFGNGVEFWSGAAHCLVEDCRLWEIYDAALTNQGDGTNVQEHITYRRNVIWNSEYSFEFWNRGPASLARDIVFEHNTCVDAGRGWGYRQRPDPNGRHLMFYDNSAITTNVVIRYNIFANAVDSLLRLHGRDWTSALRMDHNAWNQPQGVWVLWGQEKIGANGFAPFMGGRGFDQHSLLVEPGFRNAAGRDYRLAETSPLRRLTNQGQPVGALP
jgi:hypothetical protein